MPKSVFIATFPFPPEAVYAAMVDLSVWQWRSDLIGLEVHEDGRSFTEIGRSGSRTLFTITEKSPGKRYAFRMEHPNFTGEWSGEFAAVPGGAQVTFTEDLRMSRPLLRLLAPLFLPLKKMQKAYAADLLFYLTERARDAAPSSSA